MDTVIDIFWALVFPAKSSVFLLENFIKPAPKTKALAPKTKEPAPKTNAPAPKTNEPAPKTNEPAPKTKELVRGKDNITGDDDVDVVKMSCGHTAAPCSIKLWCLRLLEQCHQKFHCPADVNGEKCGKEWSYPEVRRNALLTKTEQQDFEEKLAMVAAKYYHDFKECPSCKSFVERQDLKNLRVVCILCCSLQGKVFEFCWQCLKPWKGAGAPSERCENEGCKNQSLEVLANCKLKNLPGSEIKNCPSIRACPTCGQVIKHMEMCKYIVCSQCHVEFCFACLETARNCQARKSSAHFKYCAKPLAPKQTQIPVWAQK